MRATFDAGQFAAALRTVEQTLRSKMAAACNSAARRARTEATKELSRELRLRPKEIAAPAGSEIKRATPTRLTAAWTPTPRTQNVSYTGSVKWVRGGALTFSSPSHGADRERTSAHGFLLRQKAVHRVSSAKGLKGRFAGLRQLRTPSPNVVIGQEGMKSRERWERAAELITPIYAAGAVEKAFSALGFTTTTTGQDPTND